MEMIRGLVTRGVTICLAGGAYDRLSVSLWEYARCNWGGLSVSLRPIAMRRGWGLSVSLPKP